MDLHTYIHTYLGSTPCFPPLFLFFSPFSSPAICFAFFQVINSRDWICISFDRLVFYIGSRIHVFLMHVSSCIDILCVNLMSGSILQVVVY
ncbi:hypothetical protein F5X96DRAFT_618294 [Biscogniauxia mediterranea]|nr:hypothetical protein F5X96DRAFT_618294 [Biscogniauxia mediterranea]